MTMRAPMWLRIVIVIGIGLALVTTWLTVFDTRIWPKEAHAVVCEDTYCEHPKASRRLHRKYQRDKMWKSNERSIEWVVNKPARRKIIKAYKKYTASHSYSAASPALVAVTTAQAHAQGEPAPTDWPSPGEWWRVFKGSGKCLFVGAVQTYTNAVCAVSYANNGTYFKKMAQKSRLALREATRVAIKCGGAAILGGVTTDGKRGIARAFGVATKGGWGMAGFGGWCLWETYFNRWYPW